MTLDVLLVDDEQLARDRLRILLADCVNPAALVVAEAASSAQALSALSRENFDVVLLDVRMPGADGVNLARSIAAMSAKPAIIFVTAHAEHAVQAFEVAAVDYLTKPVRQERLQQALQKAERYLQSMRAPEQLLSDEVLVIQDRGRAERLPLADVVYFKAELKYVTVRTAARSYVLDGSLSELEEKYPSQFMRVHRNALVARRAIRALEKHYDSEEGEGWAVRLNNVPELLAVSRRQVGAVREAISA
jgi:two-component system, LytTR family, response regulator AlgR